MNKFVKYILFASSVFIFPGCYYDVEEELYGNVCDTSNVTYSLSVKPIIDANCNVCHSSSSAQGGVIIDSHSTLKSYVDAERLLGAIRHEAGYSAMPKGGSKMNSCNIALIEKWVAAGAPNN